MKRSVKAMYGFIGKILRVNLANGKIREEKLGEKEARTFLGGRGLGARILFNELQPGIDPLSPKNKLIFATGPVTGAPFPGNSRYAVMAKSPLTGIWGEAHAAGFFGPELKYAGYDAVVIEEKSEAPVYLWIHEGQVELKDASHLWGEITGVTEKAIRKETAEEKTRIACIGIGGENLVRYACIISDLHRAAGRCGMGAVMGSKKLKAVAVRGTRKIEMVDEDGFRKLAKKAAKDAMDEGKDFHNYGTDGILDDLHDTGRLPTKAFRRCAFEGFEKITGETMAETILVSQWYCPACTVGCVRIVEAKSPYKVDPAYGGPEYETCASLGSLCMNDNLVAIAKANELCNKYAIDTISTGVVTAFAMECYEKGLITKKDLGGIDLTWGNHRAIVELVEKIARREGLGDILAEGVKRASKKIGKGSEAFSLHVKGQELPMHEPRGKKGLGLSYAISNRGACHLQFQHDDVFEAEKDLAPEIGLAPTIAPRYRLYAGLEKAKLVKIGEDLFAVYDSLVVCKFTTYPWGGISLANLLGIINAVTGWGVTPRELITTGERIFNLCRAFNIREEIRRRDDRLPQRLQEPLPEGLFKGQAMTEKEMNMMLDAYYGYRGWDKDTGIPLRRKLQELGLKYVADSLEGHKG